MMLAWSSHTSHTIPTKDKSFKICNELKIKLSCTIHYFGFFIMSTVVEQGSESNVRDFRFRTSFGVSAFSV